ncbi:DUF397 domain-containing protein [Streptosporangium subroseum]|uniref:DUF397 domain-containing protein n=1 Tax=Streptosporangium subroseum TaxID=106412 RepID=UPI0030853A71|nr:DUF397 domain-containing protein [Streptosporangium subroseum]
MDRIPPPAWRKSSRSAQQDNCVEAADLPGGGCAIRDSKDPNGPVLRFTSSEWKTFIGGVKNGAFDDLSR